MECGSTSVNRILRAIAIILTSILGQKTLLVQTFRELLDSIIQRALSLASSRALNNDVNLILANASFRQRRLEVEPLHEVQHCVAGFGGVRNVVA